MGIAIQFVRENSQSIEPHCFGDMNIPQLKEKLDNLSTICLGMHDSSFSRSTRRERFD